MKKILEQTALPSRPQSVIYFTTQQQQWARSGKPLKKIRLKLVKNARI